MKITDTYSICRTGKLNQFYTLYILRIISTESFYNEICYFVQNLSHNEADAISKVEKMMAGRLAKSGTGYSQTMDFCDSKKREYCDLQIFGLEWRKTAKGFIVEMDRLTQDQRTSVWETWRRDKDILKDAGFSIFKGTQFENQWFFFFRNCTNEEMEVKLATLKLRKVEKVVTGDFIGEIGNKVRINATLSDVKVNDNMYGGRTQSMIFNDHLGNVIMSFYTGQRLAPGVGTEVELKGTISKHSEFNGVNQTILKRISF